MDHLSPGREFTSSVVRSVTPQGLSTIARLTGSLTNGMGRSLPPVQSSLDHSSDSLQPSSAQSSPVLRNVGSLPRQRVIDGVLSEQDLYKDYRFQLAKTKAVHFSLKHLSSDVDLQLLNQAGEVITQSTNLGLEDESIRLTLRPGAYYLRVTPYQGKAHYRLKLRAKAFDQPGGDSRNPSDTADWTVMVYMAASNLESYALEDFLEMAAIGSSPKVNIVVQLDRSAPTDPGWSFYNPDDTTLGNWKHTRRGAILPGDIPDRSWGQRLGEVNMGDSTALQEFVTWGMTTYQARNYALVLWGHGTGFDVSYDDGVEDSISAADLSTVLSILPEPIDLVGADACLMGMTEVAYEIKDYASVFVGSQDLEPGAGYYYTPFLKDLVATPTMTAHQLGTTMVTRYGQYYDQVGYDYETLSAIDLTSFRSTTPGSLTGAFEQFVSTLMTNYTPVDLTAIATHRDTYSNTFGSGTTPDYCDVGNLLGAIATDPAIFAPIRTAAQTVVDALTGAVIQNYSAVPGRSTGLSLYFSAMGDALADSIYNLYPLRWRMDTQWDEFLNWLWW